MERPLHYQVLHRIRASIERIERHQKDREKQDAERALLLAEMQKLILEKTHIVPAPDNGGDT